MENNLKSNKNITIKIYFNNSVEDIIISSDATITELGKKICDKFLLSHFNYTISYKNKKLSMNDLKKVSYYFDHDPNPFLFIINNSILSPDCKQSRSVFLSTNLNEKGVKDLVNKFFEYKCLPFNAIIKLLLEKKYRIRFTKPVLANEFIQFYKIMNSKKIDSRIEMGLKLPNIKFRKNISSEFVLEKNRKENVLNNVIKQNHKDSLISDRTVKSGLDIYHPCYIKQLNSIQTTKRGRNKIKLVKSSYKGVFKLPFLNPDERYYREQYLDKKNWVDKKGFIVSVGNYKMGGFGCNFISNYVSATPSQPPLNHNFREIDKNKWMNKKGFY